MAGMLRVGCLSTLAPRWLARALSLLRENHPAIEVQLHEGDTEELTRMLERGSLDIALFYDLGLARAGVTLEHVGDLVPYALLPRGHPLTADSRISLAALAKEPLVLINLPHSREYFLSLFRDAGVSPSIAYETASLEMVRSLVANGLGVSLLTTRPVHDRSQDGRRLACRQIEGPVATQSLALAQPSEKRFKNVLAVPFASAIHQVLDPVIT